MPFPLRARTALTTLFACAALLFAAAGTAWAGDENPDSKPVTLTPSDGTTTVRLVLGEDGEFVLEPAQAEGATTRMRVMVKKDGEDGEVRVLEMKDGKWVPGAEPAQVEHEVFVHRGPMELGRATEGHNPMGTVLRWLMTDGMAGGLPNDPLKGWFDGGADVPMAGLRDALKAEGWTAQSLQAWFLQHLMGGMAALHAQAQAPHAVHPQMHPPVHPQMRGRWYEIGRGGGSGYQCDCDRGHRMQRGHRGNFRHGRRQGRGFGRWHAPRGGCDSGACDRRGSCNSCQGDCGSRNTCGSCDKRGSCGSCKGDCSSCDKRGARSSCGTCGSCDKRGSCGSSKGRFGSCDKQGSRGSCKGDCSSCGKCGSQGSCRSAKGDCGSCDKRGKCGSSKGDCGGDCGQKGRAPARRQAYMLWNDGSGWQHREVDAQGPVAHWGHEHPAGEGMTFRGEGTDDAPELTRMIRTLIGDSEVHSAPGSARIVVESLDLLPPDLLERIPPSVLEGVMKELEGLGLGDLLAPAKRGCEDCPKQGTCKGGDCGKGAGEKPAACCGTCKGECKDCPKAQDGACAGNCEDCPNRKGAQKNEQKECCGTCQGGAAK